MHRGFAFALLAILVALLVFLWSTSGVVSIARRTTVEQDSTAPAQAVRKDTASLPTEPARPQEQHPPGIQAPPPSASSDLVIPVEGVLPDQLVDTYDAARSQGRVHNAIDILAPKGTHVLAAADGKIVRLFLSEKGGKTIYQLAPDNHTVYYYAHLDGYAAGLKEGQTVRQGQVIGYVGDTGDAAPGNYHLHFAIWITSDPANFWDGKSVNPYPLLRGRL
ncbi:MAG TPA: M23 family metallopeptidase [Rhodothermales bacterium]|nr:M23 family metallopeptidase [Rhodothermales bacterium]